MAGTENTRFSSTPIELAPRSVFLISTSDRCERSLLILAQ